MDLSQLRQQIDTIDRQIVDLYEKRMDVSRQVAEYKIETGKKVFDKQREQEKIAGVKALTHNDFNSHGVEELFEQIAASGGEAVSHGVRLVITKDGKLKSALVGGKGIDKDRLYRIATLDYLAQGNDGLEAFKDKTGVLSPKSEENNVRHIIENYFREQEKNGRPVESRVEGRIVVE